jgi:pyruvate,water dikinase
VEKLDLKTIPQTKTKIALLLANPDLALEYSFLPNDGVGLAQMEFIISSWINVHPLALLHPEKLTDSDCSSIFKLIGPSVTSLTPEVGTDYFVSRLSSGVGLICATFWPKPVILQFSDFKTNEYCMGRPK